MPIQASIAPNETVNPSVNSANFQRSRSLGGYYKGRDLPPAPPPPPPHHAGGYQDESYILQGMQADIPSSALGALQQPGSMTPVSYARWQHDVATGVNDGNMSRNEFPNNRRHNPLYDTPPVARRPNPPYLQGRDP